MPETYSSDDDNGSHERPARVPQFLPGNPHVSLAALRERIEVQFISETANRPDILRSLDDEARREIVRDIVDYVLATETIRVSRADHLLILDVAYRDLFAFGPLDDYLADENVTEVTIDRIYIREGAGDMTPVKAYFDDEVHLEHVVQRVLATEGASLSEIEPILELGIVAEERPARLIVTGAPVSPTLHVEVRLHPKSVVTLQSCIQSGLVDSEAAPLLEQIMDSGRGIMIVGDVGTGKTTLLEALIPRLPVESCIVERAQELRLPEGMRRLVSIPPGPEQTAVSFSEQIDAALDSASPCLVLDEVRFDESDALWRALAYSPSESAPRCLWAFRGATEPRRLRAAFSMSVRRAQPGIDQGLIHKALLDRLPYVILMARQSQRLCLLSINQWQPEADQGDQPEGLRLRRLWPAET